jgi:hypothetical protein
MFSNQGQAERAEEMAVSESAAASRRRIMQSSAQPQPAPTSRPHPPSPSHSIPPPSFLFPPFPFLPQSTPSSVPLQPPWNGQSHISVPNTITSYGELRINYPGSRGEGPLRHDRPSDRGGLKEIQARMQDLIAGCVCNSSPLSLRGKSGGEKIFV